MSDAVPLLTQEVIDIDALSRAVEGPGAGAVVTFAGNVRDNCTGPGRAVFGI